VRESITVIVPTRHRASYLAVAIASVLTAAEEASLRWQATTRVLVVDDAPDDDEARAVAKRFGVDYLRITEHDGLKDPGAAIALGVQNVDTELQCIFGDDDVMLPPHLAAALEVRDSGFDVVSSSFVVTDEHLVPTRTVTLAAGQLGDLLGGFMAVNDGSLVAHDLVKDLFWDVTLESQMLAPIWAELMIAGKAFGVVEMPTWCYRRHDANISYGALTDKDVVLRAAARARMRARALEVLGSIPPSPIAAHRKELAAAAAAEAAALAESASRPAGLRGRLRRR
jgi:glycosyltransferase involved in cell wall biosynthesis